MTIFERIKFLADKSGVSLQRLAEDNEFSTNLIYRWKKSDPKAKDLAKVAGYFHVSTDYLLGRDEDEATQTNNISTMFEQLKILAKQHGMNLQDVAEKSNLSVNTIYSWKTKAPTINNLQKVADYFHVSTYYLLGRDENQAIYTDDLNTMLDNARSFDGKSITEHDRELIKSYLKGMYDSRL